MSSEAEWEQDWITAPIVSDMRLVWNQTMPQTGWSIEQLRLRDVLNKDPVGYFKDLVRLETETERRRVAVVARDRRLEAAGKRIAELEAEIASMPRIVPGEADDGQLRTEALIDQILQEVDHDKPWRLRGTVPQDRGAVG